MALTNITLSKALSSGGSAKSVVIHVNNIKEDYNNDLIIVNPGKGSSGQGTPITGNESAAKTTIKNRLRLTHSVEINGVLTDDGTNTAEYMKNLLFQMVLYGKESDSEFEVSLAGLKKIDSSGTTVAVTLKGLITKVTITELPQDLGLESEVTYEVQLQFIEGGAKDGYLESRFQKV